MKIFNYQAKAGFGVIFPTKTFVIEVNDKTLIISPSQIIAEDKSFRDLKHKDLIFIAPNNFHHMHLKTMKDIFPQAKFYGPKRSSRVSGVNLEDLNNLKLKEIKIIKLKGLKNLSESVFYLKQEKILIVTDLIFNMHHHMNLPTKLAMKLAGTYHKMGTSRLVLHSIKDKSIFKETLKELRELDVKEVIPSHGESISQETFHKWISEMLEL